MKKISPRYWLVMLLGFLGIMLFFTNYSPDRDKYIRELDRTTDLLTVADSITHSQYIQLADSARQIKDWKRARINPPADGIFFFFAGIRSAKENDIVRNPEAYNKTKEQKHYLSLSGYYFKYRNEAFRFYESRDYYFPSANKKSSFEYRFVINPDDMHEGGEIWIPVSRNTERWLTVLFSVLMFVLVVLSFYLVVISPVIVLQNIALGHAFLRQNYLVLQRAGYYLIILSLGLPFLSWLLFLFLRKYIPVEITYPLVESVLNHKSFLIAGIVFLIIAHAFKKGHKLQEDQDMTI